MADTFRVALGTCLALIGAQIVTATRPVVIIGACCVTLGVEIIVDAV